MTSTLSSHLISSSAMAAQARKLRGKSVLVILLWKSLVTPPCPQRNANLHMENTAPL